MFFPPKHTHIYFYNFKSLLCLISISKPPDFSPSNTPMCFNNLEFLPLNLFPPVVLPFFSTLSHLLNLISTSEPLYLFPAVLLPFISIISCLSCDLYVHLNLQYFVPPTRTDIYFYNFISLLCLICIFISKPLYFVSPRHTSLYFYNFISLLYLIYISLSEPHLRKPPHTKGRPFGPVYNLLWW